jgi:hypothetical protein
MLSESRQLSLPFPFRKHFFKTNYNMPSESLPVDTSTLTISEPSICIRRVFKNVTEDQVRDTMAELGLGDIGEIVMIKVANEPSKGGETQLVIVHFKKWATKSNDETSSHALTISNAVRVRQRLLRGETVKIESDSSKRAARRFWKLTASRERKREPFIDFSHTEKAAPARKAAVFNSVTHPLRVCAGCDRQSQSTRNKCVFCGSSNKKVRVQLPLGKSAQV